MKSNPYLQTITSDSDVHDNVRVAYESARDAYERLASGKSLSKSVLEDKKLHANLATAAAALRDVGHDPRGSRRQEAARRRRRRAASAASCSCWSSVPGIAVAVSSDVRNKLLDLMFGAEEEFDYTSTTAPATPAPST